MMTMVDYELVLRGSNLGLREGFLALANAVLIRTAEGPVLFDTGHYGMRKPLLAALARLGVAPGAVRAVVLSHLHYDHCHNVDLFPEAEVYVSRREWDYAAAAASEDLLIPWMIGELLQRRDLTLVEAEGRLWPGVETLLLPGHTPGLMGLSLETARGRVVLAGDALKYAKEAVAGRCDMALGSAEDGAASIRRILAMAERVVPGHFPELIKRDGAWTWDEAGELPLIVR